MRRIYSDWKQKMNIPSIPYETGQTVCTWIIMMSNKKCIYKKQWSPIRLEKDKHYKDTFFRSGRNRDLENYSLSRFILVPRKTRRNCIQRTAEIIWNLENINLKNKKIRLVCYINETSRWGHNWIILKEFAVVFQAACGGRARQKISLNRSRHLLDFRTNLQKINMSK